MNISKQECQMSKSHVRDIKNLWQKKNIVIDLLIKIILDNLEIFFTTNLSDVKLNFINHICKINLKKKFKTKTDFNDY